jgi:hypothetical protein
VSRSLIVVQYGLFARSTRPGTHPTRSCYPPINRRPLAPLYLRPLLVSSASRSRWLESRFPAEEAAMVVAIRCPRVRQKRSVGRRSRRRSQQPSLDVQRDFVRRDRNFLTSLTIYLTQLLFRAAMCPVSQTSLFKRTFERLRPIRPLPAPTTPTWATPISPWEE